MQQKKCKKCKFDKPIESFRICRLYKGMEQGSYRRSECIDCEKKSSDQLRKIKHTVPEKPKKCDCCQEITENFVPDHNHETGNFRGWLCRNCNQGIGKLGDNLEGLLRAVSYIVKNDFTHRPLV